MCNKNQIADVGRHTAVLCRRCRTAHLGPARSRHGFSLVEVLFVLTVMGILFSLAAPSFQRSLEQSRADIAAANLRAIWSAERVFWLEYRTYTTDLTRLESLGLLDHSVVSGTTYYAYAVSAAASASFKSTGTRIGSKKWTGSFTSDETGVVSGAIKAKGENDIVPGFQ